MLIAGGIAVASVYFAHAALGATPLKLDFDIHRGNSLDTLHKDNLPYISKRESGNGLELTLQNDIARYVATIKVGSNQQEMSVLVSISDSDTWVISKEAKCLVFGPLIVKKREKEPSSDQLNLKGYSGSSSYNRQREYQEVNETVTGTTAGNIAPINTCTTQGSFETSASNSFLDEKGIYEFLYYDNYADAFTEGTWGNDTISIGGANIKDFIFGIANVTALDYGRLGLGFPDPDGTYLKVIPSLPLMMKNQGIIDRVAYSLFINSLDSSSGSILFGAVDHAKYTGDLITFPMIPAQFETDLYPVIAVPLTSIHMKFDTGSEAVLTDNDYFINFDTSISMSYFPLELYNRLIEILNGTHYFDFDQVPCPKSDSSVTIDFDFNGAIISVPLTSLIISDNTGRYSAYVNQCYLAVSPLGDENGIWLGNNILRHGYFVFDLEGKSISIAQAKFTAEEDIEVMSDSIPGAIRGSSTAINTRETVHEASTQAVSYSTGTFSGPDYVSTAEVRTYNLVTPEASSKQPTASSTTSTMSKIRIGGSNRMKYSLTNTISGTIFVLLSYVLIF